MAVAIKTEFACFPANDLGHRRYCGDALSVRPCGLSKTIESGDALPAITPLFFLYCAGAAGSQIIGTHCLVVLMAKQFSLGITRFYFKESLKASDIFGMSLILLGILGLLWL